MGIDVSKHLKEQLACATDKRLILIQCSLNNYTTKKLKNKDVLTLKQHCMHCYVVLSNVWRSN